MKPLLLILIPITGALLLWLLWPSAMPAPDLPIEVAAEAQADDDSEELQSTGLGAETEEPSIARVSVEPNFVFEQMFGDTDLEAERVSVATGTLSGRLVWRLTGMPIEGAYVGLTRTLLDTVIPTGTAPVDWKGKHFLPQVASSDREGRFTLQDVPARRDLYFYIEHGHHLVDVRKVARLPHDAGEVVVIDDIELDARGSVAGRIVGVDGTPVLHAQIRAVDDYVYRNRIVDRKASKNRTAFIEMFNSRGLWNGKKLGKWELTRDRLLPFVTGSSSETGRFVLRGVRPGRVHLIISRQGHPPRHIEAIVEVGRTTEIGVCSFEEPSHPVRFRVIDPLLRPVAKIGVLAAMHPMARDGMDSIERFAFSALPTETGKGGWADCPLPKKSNKLSIYMRRARKSPWEAPVRRRSREWPDQHERCGNKAAPGASYQYILPPLMSRLLQVTVNGARVEHARIKLDPEAASHRIRFVRPGLWEIKGLIPNVATKAFVSAPGCSLETRNITVAWIDGGETLDGTVQVNLKPTFGMDIEVRDELGMPVPDVRLDSSIGGRQFYLGRTDVDGVLRVSSIWQVPIQVSAVHPHGAGRSEVFLPVPGRREVITLRRIAIVRGRITEDGRSPPIKRWRVVASNVRLNRRDRPLPSVTTLAEEDGAFEFMDLRAGKWSITLAPPSQPGVTVPGSAMGRRIRNLVHGSSEASGPRMVMYVTLRAGEQRHVDIVIGEHMNKGGRRVAGRFLWNGQPPTDAYVRGRVWTRGKPKSDPAPFVYYSGGKKRVIKRKAWQRSYIREMPSVGVGADGSFNLLGLSSKGVCELEFGQIKGGRWLPIHAMEFDIGEQKTDLHVDVATSYVMLTMFDGVGVPLRGRQVRIEEVDGLKSFLTIASAQGTVEFTALAAGKYRVTILDASGVAPTLDNPILVAKPGGTIYEDRHCLR